MSVFNPRITGEPATVKVLPAVKVELAEGAHVRYVGRSPDYYGTEMVVAAIRSAAGHGAVLYLKRPRTSPKYGYVITAQPCDVLALGYELAVKS